ncbi:MAG: SHOCT-like domain-containing protein [Tepidiformaceae bacterium]
MPEHDDELGRARDEARRAREEADRLRHEARTLEQRLREEARATAHQERELARAMRDEARKAADQLGHGPHRPGPGWSDSPRGRGRPSSSAGDEQSAQAFSLDGVRAVLIDQTAGTVTVRYCGEGETPGVVSVGKSAPQLEVRRDGDSLKIELKMAKGWIFRRRQGPVTTVRLLPGLEELRVSVGYGELDVRDIECAKMKFAVSAGKLTTYSTTGQLDADMGAGKITLNVHRGLASCDTGTGDLMMDIAEVVAGSYRANVGMGRVEVRLPFGAEIHVEATSGIGKARNEFGGSPESAPSRLKIESGIGETVVKVRDVLAATPAPPAFVAKPQRPGRTSAGAGRRRHEADELRILQMLEQGRITSQDAADLIAALQGTTSPMGEDEAEAPEAQPEG